MPEYSIQYIYQRGGVPTVPAGSNFLSNHHVVSYPFMFALGAISLAYIKLYEGENTSEITNFCRAFNVNRDTILNGVNLVSGTTTKITFRESLNQLLTKICWTEANLFIGPAGKVRSDDPSQKDDKIPLSIQNSGLSGFMKEIIRLRSTMRVRVPNEIGAGGYRSAIRKNENEIQRIGKGFIELLNQYKSIRTYQSLVKDWVVLIERKYYPVVFYRNWPRERRESLTKIQLSTGSEGIDQENVFRIYRIRDHGDRSGFVGFVAARQREDNDQQSEVISNKIVNLPFN